VSDSVRLRRAEPDDADFLLELTTHEDVEPYLAGSRPRDLEGVLEEIERSAREPEEFGRFVVEVQADGQWRRVGAMGFQLANRRSRIANLGNLAIHPDFRGRRLADAAARLFQRQLFELGFHRLQLEIYGFNERAMAHAERAGFVREGVRRRAYWRHDDWVDGVLYGLVREDLAE
jgi:RimJ/RimL family protein N-acetyltransferase